MTERKKGLYPYQMGAANFMAQMRSAERMRRASIERAKAEGHEVIEHNAMDATMIVNSHVPNLPEGDVHQALADELGISREKAKVINYSGLYGVRRLPKGLGKTEEKK